MDHLQNLLPSPEACTELNATEAKIVHESLALPAVQKYFRHLHFNCLKDICENEASTKEEQEKLLARFLKLRGITHILSTLLIFGRKS